MTGDVVLMDIRVGVGPLIRLRRREAWTLAALLDAGDRGVTPRERPAPRWSAYVLGLRRKGLPIDTVREQHGGPYPGPHGRYRLAGPVTVLAVVRAGEACHAA